MSDEEVPQNIVSINRKKKTDKPVPLSKAEVFEIISSVISNDLIQSSDPRKSFPPFPVKFLCISPEKGVQIPLIEDENQVCTIVSKDFLTKCILNYMVENAWHRGTEFQFVTRQAEACADFWLNRAEIIEEPVAVRWLNEEGRCYNRLPFEKKTDDFGEFTPLFNELLSRITNNEALMCFVGSLFFPESDLQQYLHLFGSGGDGKGVLTRIIEKAFGKAFHSENIPTGQVSQFWSAAFLGKRIVCFSDADKSNFITTGAFKSLTGGDTTRMEIKGGQIFNAKLKTKYLFIANSKPKISAKTADTRRVIYCEITPPAEKVMVWHEYEEALWQEAGYFFSNCIQYYLEVCPRHQAIPFDSSDIVTWGTADGDEMQVKFDEVFEYRAALPGELERNRPSVSPTQFELRLNFLFKDQARPRKEFREWVEDTYGVHKKRIKNPDGTLDNKYVGLVAKEIPQEPRVGR